MDTKNSLLNIGLELFSRAPYEAVGVQDIVASAQMTKPTLYHHFGSKLGFYQAVCRQFVEPFLGRVLEKTQYCCDLTKNLNEIAVLVLDSARQKPNICHMIEFALVTAEQSEHHDFVQNYREELLHAVLALFTAAEAQHGNIRGKEDLLARSLIAILAVQAAFVARNPGVYRNDMPYNLVKQFMYGIFA